MQVYFSPSARQSLRDASDFVARASPAGGRRLRRRIIYRARQLAEFRNSGRVVPEFGTPVVRELIEGAYRIWYRVLDDEVEIMAIIHGSRQVAEDS